MLGLLLNFKNTCITEILEAVSSILKPWFKDTTNLLVSEHMLLGNQDLIFIF